MGFADTFKKYYVALIAVCIICIVIITSVAAKQGCNKTGNIFALVFSVTALTIILTKYGIKGVIKGQESYGALRTAMDSSLTYAQARSGVTPNLPEALEQASGLGY